MAKTLAYMVTWTTYGTWLQGDERGYVKDGQILKPDADLEAANLRNLQKHPVRLTTIQKEIVNQAIAGKAERLGQNVLAIAVCQNHVHLVIAYNGTPIEFSVKHYKNAAISALRKHGLACPERSRRNGRVWSSGFDKRFCFDEKSLRKRINYVNDHNK
jgi:REP element-mobilizing transposase RayT